eukprot:3700026-Prymnesium_polylepis.1
MVNPSLGLSVEAASRRRGQGSALSRVGVQATYTAVADGLVTGWRRKLQHIGSPPLKTLLPPRALDVQHNETFRQRSKFVVVACWLWAGVPPHAPPER